MPSDKCIEDINYEEKKNNKISQVVSIVVSTPSTILS